MNYTAEFRDWKTGGRQLSRFKADSLQSAVYKAKKAFNLTGKRPNWRYTPKEAGTPLYHQQMFKSGSLVICWRAPEGDE